MGWVCEHVMDLMVCKLDELIESMQLPLEWQAATHTSMLVCTHN